MLCDEIQNIKINICDKVCQNDLSFHMFNRALKFIIAIIICIIYVRFLWYLFYLL